MNDELFQVVILAGGLATRLHPLTISIPKALITIGSEPFIFHQLRLLKKQGIRNVLLCVGHLGEQIRGCVGDGNQFGLNVLYSFDGPSLLGTAGAIQRALPQLRDTFFVLYGDSYLPCDYFSVQKHFKIYRKPALMTVFRNHGQWEKSNLEFYDGAIVAYDKKNPTDRMQYIDYGLAVFNKTVFENSHAEYNNLENVYQALLDANALAAFEVMERFYEIGSFSGIEELNTHLTSAVR